MKIFTAAMLTESSDLMRNPVSTTLADWQIDRYGPRDGNRSKFGELLLLFRELSEAKGWEVVEGPCATSFPPGGPTLRSAYEHIRTMILNDLRNAMPVDGVLLQLHGAAIAHGYDDCEGDLLERVRDIVGPDIPIGVELDPHCHLTMKMVANSTAIVAYKTFQHTDMKDRALELFKIIASAMNGEIEPVMALFDCRMIDSFDEVASPEVKSFYNRVYEAEKRSGILSISPIHGFPTADVAEMGSKMLVIADQDHNLAARTAEELGMAFFETRGRLLQVEGIENELDEALEKTKSDELVVLVEFGDSAGGGFATDGMTIIETMLKRGMTNVAVGMIWDPLAVSICHDIGPGGELRMRIGGKVSFDSGTPLDLDVIIERVYKDIVINNWSDDKTPCDAAVVRAGKTELLLVSKRLLPSSLKPFKQLGVDLSSKQYVLAKYIGGIGADKETVGRHSVVFLSGAKFDFRKWPTRKMSRPKWPWDENPFDDDDSGRQPSPVKFGRG